MRAAPVALALLVLACWLALLAQAWRAGGEMPFLAALCAPGGGPKSPGLAGFLGDGASRTGLWVLMSIAMMLPTAVPMLFSHRDAAARSARPGPRPAAGATAWLAAGYLSVWCGVSLLAGFAQAAGPRLLGELVLPPGLESVLAGALVGAAGLYQFSALKQRCLAFCRRDVRAQDLPAGVAGSLRQGLREGRACLGCCGPVMALMLLAGFANLFWMAAFALAMTVEKLIEGPWATRLIGVMLCGAGFAVAAAPVGISPVLGTLARLITGGSP